MTTSSVNERTTAYLQVSFRDKAGVLALPTAVSYRLDCLTSGQAVLPDTALVAAAELEITLSADHNAMRVATNRSEQRRVTVVASYGSTADQASAEFDYQVLNLAFVAPPA